jgi:hypothetical protein
MTSEVLAYFRRAIDTLAKRGIAIAPPLTEKELGAVEVRVGFVFPPDLRQLLAVGLPVSDGFPDWRGESTEALRDLVGAPVDGILGDVETGDFWNREWGARPQAPDAARIAAAVYLARAPVLVPVYSHRYLPTRPADFGNPVFSVMQSDVIHYGADLPGYLAGEFRVRMPEWARKQPRHIEFWTDMIEQG